MGRFTPSLTKSCLHPLDISLPTHVHATFYTRLDLPQLCHLIKSYPEIVLAESTLLPGITKYNNRKEERSVSMVDGVYSWNFPFLFSIISFETVCMRLVEHYV